MKKSINICLNYHDFSNTGFSKWKNSKFTIDFRSFKTHLDLLTSVKCISLHQLDRFPLPDEEKTYSLTIDDGYKSGLYIAEELSRRKLTGTFFVIKKKTGSEPGYLDIRDIKEMDRMGMEFGSHTCTHRHLNRLKIEELKSELLDSRSFLEDILSKQVRILAFPGGHYGKRELMESAIAGYSLNRTSIIGANNLPVNDGIIKIVPVTNKIDSRVFNDIISLSSLFFFKSKLREKCLILPKYLHSRFFTR